jgi:hypothetical protein
MNDVHQDYVRERELIKTMKLLHDQLEHLVENLSERLRREVEDRFTQLRADLGQHTSRPGPEKKGAV